MGIRNVEEGNWESECAECGWSKDGYDEKGKAEQALVAHKRFRCQVLGPEDTEEDIQESEDEGTEEEAPDEDNSTSDDSGADEPEEQEDEQAGNDDTDSDGSGSGTLLNSPLVWLAALAALSWLLLSGHNIGSNGGSSEDEEEEVQTAERSSDGIPDARDLV